MPPHEETLRLDNGAGTVAAVIILPEGTEPAPAVLFCDDPGAGASDAPDLSADIADALTGAGLVAAKVEPRSDDDRLTARAADLVDGASAAFRSLLLHDRVDSGRVGVLGLGLGAVTAACLAGRTDQIRGLCLLSAVTGSDLMKSNGALRPAAAEKLGEPFVTSLADLSPVQDIAAHDRPTLILHGAADRTVSPESARPYIQALRRAGGSAAHELIAFADHDLSDPAARASCLARITQFFRSMSVAPVGA